MTNSIPDLLKERIRVLLGGRGFIKAWNDPAQKKKLLQITQRMEELRLGADEIHEVFLRAKDGRNGLDDILDQIGKPQGSASSREKTYTPHPAALAASSGTAASVAHRAAVAATRAETGEIGRDESAREEISRLRSDLESTRRRSREIEDLARALTERAVLDATRIKGLEAAIMTVAHAAGMAETIEQAYFTATAQYLDPRIANLRRVPVMTEPARRAGALPLP